MDDEIIDERITKIVVRKWRMREGVLYLDIFALMNMEITEATFILSNANTIEYNIGERK